jgi:thiamine transport system substrate-binding protein
MEVPMKRLPYLFLFVCVLCASACIPKENTLTVMTHDSFSVSTDVVAAFEQANNVKLVFLKSGDAGVAINKAILAKNAPLADLFYGVDNTFLSRALDAGIFEPYDSPLLIRIPAAFVLDTTHQLLPVDYGDVCINYDKAWFERNALPVPGTLDDLLKPEYQGLLVVENPASSSPGLAFLIATVARFGDPGYLDYWASLRENGLIVANDWNTAYYTNFSASSGHGLQPLVVSYASSPAAEVVYADPPVDSAPTASIQGTGTCFRQIEFAGILKGTRNRLLAEKFIDFILDVQFQQDIPLQMFMYPVNLDAQLPVVFVQWAQVANQPAVLDPTTISTNRDRWIADWTETVLR